MRYVSHISGRGAQWPLFYEQYNENVLNSDWAVRGKNGDVHYLPRSEFTLVNRPQEWRDITDSCLNPLTPSETRRLRKVYARDISPERYVFVLEELS